MSTPEVILLRFEGGPYAGDRSTFPGATWPPPDSFYCDTPAGRYVKVGQSTLPPTAGVVRGARYAWRPRCDDDAGGPGRRCERDRGHPYAPERGESHKSGATTW